MYRQDQKTQYHFMNNTLEKKTNIFYFLSIIALASILVFFYYNNEKIKSTNVFVDHSNEVRMMNDDVLIDILNIETGTRGYVITGNEIFLEPYIKSANKIHQNLDRLKKLSQNNPSQLIRIKVLKEFVDKRLIFSSATIKNQKDDIWNNTEKKFAIEEGKYLTDTIRTIINNINSEELRLLKYQKIENEKTNQTSNISFALLLFLIIIIFILVIFILKNHKKRNIEVKEFIAEQKVLSEYSLSLIEASRDPLFTISPKGKITDTNEASARVTGVTKKELIGSDFFDYFTDSVKAREGYKEVFSKGFVVDYPLTILDEKFTEVLFNGSVYKDEQENVIGAVMVARDITEQKRIEREFIEAKVFAELATTIAEEEKNKAQNATIIAEEAVKSKQQFLSNMSHEIRTPMNAIIGFTKVVLKTDLTVKQKEYLNAIKISGDALIVLINDILDLAKVDAGKMQFEQIPFKLRSSIAAMLHLFESKIEEKNLKFIREFDPAIPQVLVGDPVRLHQIILNLISNAVKFTSKGKITVIVKLIEEDDVKVILEFAISDTGIGISESKIETVFENFQQATSGTSRLYGGTGLGLAIVKQLVEPQGGSIKVESIVKEGSTFSFRLPFLKTKAQAQTELEILELDNDIKNLKVLVVEDMALNQLLMKTVLDDFGFERDIAENGKIAIEKLENNTYDIILMDLQMPEMNGFDATEYIRNTMKLTIPIIALTADVTTVDLEKCKAVGMNDYLAKPIDERLLYTKIVSLIKKNSVMNEDNIENKVPEIPKIKYINLLYLNQRTKSNPVLMMEMISIYLQQTPPLISSMKLSYTNKDWKSLHSAVHKMIPSFSIMGISTDFENMAKKVQEFANTQQEEENINEMVIQLEKVLNQSCSELEEELNRIKNIKS